MEIRNPTEFKNFVTLNGLSHQNAQLEAVVTCITDYERGCDCWKEKDRQTVYNNCRVLYQRGVAFAMSNMRDIFLKHTPDGKLTFYLDGGIIGSMRR